MHHSGSPLLILSLFAGLTSDSRAIQTPGRTFAAAIACVGDYDGDGFPDCLVSDPGQYRYARRPRTDGRRGRVWLLSGADGKTLWERASDFTGDGFGASLCSPGDLDGDGVQDWLVGNNDLRERQVGQVTAFSGVDGEELFRLAGEETGERFGYRLYETGDVNGDLVADFAVQSPDRNCVGAVSIYSGRDHVLLRSWLGSQPDELTDCSLVGLGDVNGDGCADVAMKGYLGKTSAAPHGQYRLQVRSGKDDALIWSRGPGRYFEIARGADYDQDGFADLLFSQGEDLIVLSGRDGVLVTQWHLRHHNGFDFMQPLSLEGNEAALCLLVTDSGAGVAEGRVGLLSLESGERIYDVTVKGGAHWHLGQAMSILGDLDDDGVKDFAVGSDPFLARSEFCPLWIRSGRTGEALLEFERVGDRVELVKR